MNPNWNQLATLLVAGCALFAVATTGSTLDSAVSDTPAEAIEFDYSSLPVDGDSARELSRQVRESSEGDQERSQPNQAAQSENPSSNPQEASGQERQRSDGEDDQSKSSTQQSGAGLDDPSWLQQFLQWLLSLLVPLLMFLAAVAAIVGGLWALRRYVDPGTGDDDEGAEWYRSPGTPSPTNDVSQAWYELMHRTGVAEEHHLTPRERVRTARRRVADADAAESLTNLFEETKYGTAGVTDERRRKARQWLDRALGNSSGRPGDGTGSSGRDDS
jgi:hypothetical protein